MILRRVIRHVRNQEWTAILIDFLIVVVGVYLGIELGNWNDARDAKSEYRGALQRLAVEIDTNLATLDSVEPAVLQSLRRVRNAFEALQSCTESESNRQAVNTGLAEIRGTYGLHLRRTALQELTNSPRLLAQQTASDRKRFTDMLFYFDLMQLDANFSEYHPLEGRIQDNPIIRIGPSEEIVQEYFGVDYSGAIRPLLLAVPIDEACQNNQLIKSFFTWENWQDNLPIYFRQIRNELVATKAHLAER